MLLFTPHFHRRIHGNHFSTADWVLLLTVVGICIIVYLYRWITNLTDTDARISLVESIRNDPARGIEFQYGIITPVIRVTLQPAIAQLLLSRLSERKRLKGFNFDHVQLIDPDNLLPVTSFEYTTVDNPGRVDIAHHFFVLRYYPDALLMKRYHQRA